MKLCEQHQKDRIYTAWILLSLIAFVLSVPALSENRTIERINHLQEMTVDIATTQRAILDDVNISRIMTTEEFSDIIRKDFEGVYEIWKTMPETCTLREAAVIWRQQTREESN